VLPVAADPGRRRAGERSVGARERKVAARGGLGDAVVVQKRAAVEQLDIELACKLARNGNSPMEIPVNYVARGFDEGKKIRFWRDAWPSYKAFFKYRLG